MEKLKPCPFCRGEELDFRFVCVSKFTKPYLFVGCQKCGGMMVDTNMDHCLDDVFNAWNRRGNNEQS